MIFSYSRVNFCKPKHHNNEKNQFLSAAHFASSCNEENQPPTCEIIHPQNNTFFELGENIAVSIEASDPDGLKNEIQLCFGGSGITSLKDFPYTYIIGTNDYTPGEYAIMATAIDNEVSSISDSSAVCGGAVLDDGGADITSRGVCWSTSSGPTK